MPIVEKQAILKKKSEQKDEIRVDPEDHEQIMEIWIRDITFFDVQKAAQNMFLMDGNDVSLDLQGYWNHAFSEWVVKTNPELSPSELLEINAYAGQQIAALLPKPDELAEAMQGGFTKANN
jgi:hypothetical protein